MTPCPVDPSIDCTGPDHWSLWWICPVHGARLTIGWTEICRAKANYRQAWMEGHGPGQPKRKTEPLAAISRADVIPDRAQARRIVCLACPDGNWDHLRNFCPLVSNRPCTMRSQLNGPRKVCRHWSE